MEDESEDEIQSDNEFLKEKSEKEQEDFGDIPSNFEEISNNRNLSHHQYQNAIQAGDAHSEEKKENQHIFNQNQVPEESFLNSERFLPWK